MGAMIGLVIGYMLGTRAGEKGFEELSDALRTITTSQEVRDMVAGGMSLAGDLLQKGRAILVERLRAPDEPGALRRAA